MELDYEELLCTYEELIDETEEERYEEYMKQNSIIARDKFLKHLKNEGIALNEDLKKFFQDNNIEL